jgi:hypothetical protein
MYVLLAFLLLVLANLCAAQSKTVDPHLREEGSGAIFARSAFAHGYRHGYEEGYHAGNIDVNMSRLPRTKLSQFHGVSSRYTAECGPRKSFEAGFEEGLKAGYNDGFVGRPFRAIENLRFLALALDPSPVATDPANLYFDQGFSTGYDHGLDHAQKAGSEAANLNLRLIGCAQFHPGKHQDIAAEGSFCDGYRRGYVLGHADGIVLAHEAMALAARQ